VAILLVAIAAGFGAFWLCTFFGTSDLRSVTADRDADLMWLRRESDLADLQFQRIQALHTAYASKCDLMCRRIMNANTVLDVAISKNMQEELRRGATHLQRPFAFMQNTTPIELARLSGSVYLPRNIAGGTALIKYVVNKFSDSAQIVFITGQPGGSVAKLVPRFHDRPTREPEPWQSLGCGNRLGCSFANRR
jgi:hypothetical protein